MEASFSKWLSQSECRIKITSQLLSESECRNLGCDLTQKTQTNKMVEAWHNADKHYLFKKKLEDISPFSGPRISLFRTSDADGICLVGCIISLITSFMLQSFCHHIVPVELPLATTKPQKVVIGNHVGCCHVDLRLTATTLGWTLSWNNGSCHRRMWLNTLRCKIEYFSSLVNIYLRYRL